VLLKSGEISHAPLNYYAYDQTILFEKDGKILTLTGLPSIDTIYISERKFVPVNNTVYEVVTNTGKVNLYLSYASKINPMVATADYNGTSKQSTNQVNNTVTNVYISRPYKGDYSIEIIKHYWLKKGDLFYKANSAKQFIKPFSSQMRSAIEQYIEPNHVDFNKQNDLIKLVSFCNGK
jgi:hypothetical protein